MSYVVADGKSNWLDGAILICEFLQSHDQHGPHIRNSTIRDHCGYILVLSRYFWLNWCGAHCCWRAVLSGQPSEIAVCAINVATDNWNSQLYTTTTYHLNGYLYLHISYKHPVIMLRNVYSNTHSFQGHFTYNHVIKCISLVNECPGTVLSDCKIYER